MSVQKIFERVPRPAGNPGKGGLWRLTPMFEIETRSGSFNSSSSSSSSHSSKQKGGPSGRKSSNKGGKRKRSTRYNDFDDEEDEESVDFEMGDDDDEFNVYEKASVSNTPRKRFAPSNASVSLPTTPATTTSSSQKQSTTTTTTTAKFVESTGGTLVNSPFVTTTTKLNPQEYQGTHLMDTLANIALSAEAHNYDWIQPPKPDSSFYAAWSRAHSSRAAEAADAEAQEGGHLLPPLNLRNP